MPLVGICAGGPGNRHPYRDRWNRYTFQRFLNVRIHVLNGTLEDAFSHWHKGFRPHVAA